MRDRISDWVKGQGRLIRSLGRWASLPYHAMRRERRAGVVVLLYHRVGGGTRSEIDTAVQMFDRQMHYLRRHCVVVSLDEVAGINARPAADNAHRDIVAVTFDDGYQETYDLVYPVLRRYGIPATIYLPGMYLEERRPFDFGAYEQVAPTRRPRPLNWDQVAEMVRSGLVSIGAHTHTHVDFSRASVSDALRELDDCDRVIELRLGFRPKHFAYPWGHWAPATHALVASRYETVTLGGPGKNPYIALDLSRLWRYPVIQSDGFWLFRARLHTLRTRDDNPPDTVAAEADRNAQHASNESTGCG